MNRTGSPKTSRHLEPLLRAGQSNPADSLVKLLVGEGSEDGLMEPGDGHPVIPREEGTFLPEEELQPDQAISIPVGEDEEVEEPGVGLSLAPAHEEELGHALATLLRAPCGIPRAGRRTGIPPAAGRGHPR
jgi:hypothetical protein